MTAATIPKLRTWRRCTLSKIDVEYDLDEAIKSEGKVFVLFYASCCPFSRIFLPLFDKYAKENPQGYLRVKTDDKAKLCEKYSENVVLTVLIFEKGKVKKRLDETPDAGLNERQLKDIVNEH